MRVSRALSIYPSEDDILPLLIMCPIRHMLLRALAGGHTPPLLYLVGDDTLDTSRETAYLP